MGGPVTKGHRRGMAAIAAMYCQHDRCGRRLPCAQHPEARRRARRDHVLPQPPKVEFVTRKIPVPARLKLVEVRCWRITLQEVYPSQNVLMRRYGNHHAYRRLIDHYVNLFRVAMLSGNIPAARGRRKLVIRRVVRSERYRLDRGNLVGGGKPFLDAAVRAGLIVDDREEHLDDHYEQAIDTTERIEVDIFET